MCKLVQKMLRLVAKALNNQQPLSWNENVRKEEECRKLQLGPTCIPYSNFPDRKSRMLKILLMLLNFCKMEGFTSELCIFGTKNF